MKWPLKGSAEETGSVAFIRTKVCNLLRICGHKSTCLQFQAVIKADEAYTMCIICVAWAWLLPLLKLKSWIIFAVALYYLKTIFTFQIENYVRHEVMRCSVLCALAISLIAFWSSLLIHILVLGYH